MGRISEVVSELLDKYKKEKEEQSTEPKQESYAQVAARLEEKYPTKQTAQLSPQENYAQIAARLEKEYSPEKNAARTQAVSDWGNRYNSVIQGVLDSSKQGNTGNAKGSMDGYIAEIDSLISDYESIREYADRFGMVNSPRYVQQLKDLKTNLNAIYHPVGAVNAGLTAADRAKSTIINNQAARYKADHAALVEDIIAGRASFADHGQILTRDEQNDLIARMQDMGIMPTYESSSKAENSAALSERVLDHYREMYDAGWRPPKYNDGSFGDALKASWGITWSTVKAGLGEFSKGIMTSLDVTAGDGLQALGWKNNPISKLADQVDAEYAAIKKEQAQAIYDAGFKQGDKFVNITTNILEQSIASTPHLILALYTGGASAGPSAASLMTNAVAQTASKATLARMAVTQMLKNPQFQLSLARSLGTDYEEAKADGAGDTAAGFYAVITSFLNAGIEIGLTGESGIQGIPQSGGKPLLDWITSSLEEGGEEILQGVVSDALAKVIYDEDREVLDTEKMLTEGAMGTAVGAVMGGSQIVSQNAISKRQSANGTTVQDSTVEQAAPSAEEKWQNNLREAVWAVMDSGKKDTAQTPVNQKNTAPDGTEGKAEAIAHQDPVASVPQFSESTNDGIRTQLRNNQEQLNGMAPVAAINTPKEFTGMDLTQKADWIVEKLRPTGYKVDRKGFGIINFAKKHLRSALNYFKSGSVEEAAFEALPHVLENGVEIASHEDHKGRGYNTVTIAAPVLVNGRRGNMAVVVRKTTGNYYKVHRILSPDGSVFQLSETIREAEPTIAGESPETGSLATPKGSASGDIIFQPGENVNNDYLQNYKTRAIDRSSTSRPASADTVDISRPAIAPVKNSISENAPAVNNNSKQGAVGAAEQNFSGKATYQDLLTDDNTQPDRPGDVRPMEVPKVDSYGRKVSETVGNAYGAEITPDHMASKIEELVADGALGFDIRSNQQSMASAAKAIKDKGAAATKRSITQNVANGKLKDGDIEKAMLLYAAYANQNTQDAQDNAAELMVDLATMANMTGRNLQLFKMLRKMTPQGQRMAVQKAIDRYVETLNSKRGKKKQVAVSIPQELWEAYEEAATKDLYSKTEKTEKEKAAIEDAIYKAAAAQIGATAKEKLNAWRYMAMLGNVKTQARNVAGNALFRPLVNTKRAIGAAMEAMFVDKHKRTKSLLGFGKESRALLDWAKADAKKTDAQKLFSYSAKTGDNARSQIEDSRKIFDHKWLEATREFVQKVPEAADNLFKRREYAVSLASFLKARGYKMGSTISPAVLNEAREYAAQEALKATFNDMNAFSDMIVKMRYKGENPVGKVFNVLGEGVLPFRRTPANILVRGIEYSPLNFVRGIYNTATKVRSGEMSAATAIDQMASGLTGTGLMALGYVLAQGLFGIKLVGYEDDEDKKNAGHQSYAIEIGNKSFTVDWAAPANLPVFVGANLYNAWKDKDPDTGWLMSTLSASAKTLEPMLELSCLSSLNDLIQDVSYADEDMKPYTLVSSMATSYLNQFIPTLFGQVEQALEPEKTQVYSDADDPVQRRLETTLGQMTRKLPGDLFQAKKYDAWGNEEKTSNWFESFISPSYTSDLSDDPVDAEIMRLNEAQDINVTVKKPSKTLSYTDSSGEKHTDHRLTAAQWEVMQKEYGQTAHAVLTELMENYSYEAMTDTQKAEAFRLAYDYARETARIAAVAGYPGYSDGWMDGIKGGEADAIIEKLTLDSMSDAISDLTSAWKYGRDDTAAVAAVEEAYSLYDNLTSRQLKAVMQESTGRVEACYAAMTAGIEARTFADLYQTYYNISNSDSKPTQKANSWAAELQRAKEKGIITNMQMKTMKENLAFSSGFTVGTEKFDDLTGSGFSANESSYIIDLIGDLIPSSGRSTVSDVQKAEALADSNLSEKDKQAAMMLYLSDSQGENLEQMVSKGYSAEDYAHVYRIYYDEDQKGGKGTKARTIAKIREMLGCSYSTAEAVYKIYAS